jgi:hypothetical protein
MAIKKVRHKVKLIKNSVNNKLLKLIGYTYKGKKNKPIIFILSTGRCGSTSIKKMFNQHGKFIAFHEDIVQLIELSTQLAEHIEQEKEVYLKLDNIFSKRIWEGKEGQVIVHSDHRLWNLVPYLSNYFKNAFFIHLIRNPSDSVKSYLQRDWHLPKLTDLSKNKFDAYRLQGNRVNDMSDEAWGKLNQTEKCLWYWNFVNTSIYNSLKPLDKECWDVIKLEDFVEDMNRVVKIKFQLDAGFFFENEITNQSKKIESNELLDSIKFIIGVQNEHLFLTYYPND